MPVITILPFIVKEQQEIVSQNMYVMLIYSSVILILIFYLNYTLLFPIYYLKKKKIKYFFLVILIIAIVIIISRITMVKYFAFHAINAMPKTVLVAFAIFRIMLAFFLSSALIVYERWQKSEREKLIAEVYFLKAQINPHFLFNTLNGIYTLVLKKSDNAAESVSKLSALMQYVATDATKENVLLENEINYISNYIELQKLRLTNTTQINFSVTGNLSALQIEPLLLISFIENAFKHGVSTEIECIININISIEANNLFLQVQNQKVKRVIEAMDDTGIGMYNTINRLNKSYPNHHALNITEDKESYTVNLSLQLK